MRNKLGNGGGNELWLVSDIGADYDQGITVEAFAKDLAQLDGGRLTVLINSAGGCVFTARALSGLLRQYPGTVVGRILGLAASSASFLALSLDRVEMLPGAFVMIHAAHAFGGGTASDHRKLASELGQISESILQTYVARTKAGAASEAELRAWMQETKWLDAPTCQALGWCDAIVEGQRYAAHAPINPSRLKTYRNVPP